MTNGRENLTTGVALLLTPALARPQDLKIDVQQSGSLYSVTASVHGGDMPRMIGSGGANIRALKVILGHIGARNEAYIRFTAVDPSNPSRERFATVPTLNWERKPLLDAVRAALRMARYDDTLMGPVQMADKFFLTCPAVLDAAFAESLARWTHVMGRALGGNVVFVNERSAAV